MSIYTCFARMPRHQRRPLYIHAKMILTDYGQSGQQSFVGSENFSNPSLTESRELGLPLTDPAILQSLNTTFRKATFMGVLPGRKFRGLRVLVHCVYELRPRRNAITAPLPARNADER
jgi:hypothetical protein